MFLKRPATNATSFKAPGSLFWKCAFLIALGVSVPLRVFLLRPDFETRA